MGASVTWRTALLSNEFECQTLKNKKPFSFQGFPDFEMWLRDCGPMFLCVTSLLYIDTWIESNLSLLQTMLESPYIGKLLQAEDLGQRVIALVTWVNIVKLPLIGAVLLSKSIVMQDTAYFPITLPTKNIIKFLDIHQSESKEIFSVYT